MKLKKRSASPLNLSSPTDGAGSGQLTPIGSVSGSRLSSTSDGDGSPDFGPDLGKETRIIAGSAADLTDENWSAGWASGEPTEPAAAETAPVQPTFEAEPPALTLEALAARPLADEPPPLRAANRSTARSAPTSEADLLFEPSEPQPTPPPLAKTKPGKAEPMSGPFKAAASSDAPPQTGAPPNALHKTAVPLKTPPLNTPPLALRYRSPPRQELGGARYAYLAAGFGAVIWVGSFMAFMIGFQQNIAPLTYVPFQSVILAVLTVLPAAFMMLAAYAVRQGARMGSDARLARRLAEDMVIPAAQAASETTSVLESVRLEVDRAAAATRLALEEVSALRDSLTQETERLSEAAGDAQRTARLVGETLAHERDEIANLTRDLRAGAEDIVAAVSQQSHLVVDASDLARTQLQEVEATLIASAAGLTAATVTASQSAQDAGDKLAQQIQFLDGTGAALAERLRFLDARLMEQRDGLNALVERCDDDQDEIAIRLETRRAQLAETIAEAYVSARDLTDASGQGADALRALIAAAADQMRDLVQSAEAERAMLAQTAAETLTHLSDQAREAQDVAGAHAQAARVQVEQLGQLAFDAGQRANQAFEGRIADARRLIEQSAALVEEAGVRSAARIESGLEATRGALSDLTLAFVEIDNQMARMPDTARAQAEAVRAAVERGANELAAAVRKLSIETRAIDDAFQERVRKNYETLSEAAKVMAKAAPPPQPRPAALTTAPILRREAPPPPPTPNTNTRAADQADVDSLRRALAEAEEDFVAPEVVYERQSAAAPKHEAGWRSERPAFGGGRPLPATPPVFGRAQRSATGEGEAGPAAALIDAPERTDPTPSAPSAAAIESAPRPRLKLTPTEADTAIRHVFDPVAPRPRDAGRPPSGRNGGLQPPTPDLDDWTWRDLLASLKQEATGDDALAGVLIEEISALGVDAAALLPRDQLEAIATTTISMGPAAARDSVRRLAPAAVRRLSRRVLTNTVLRDQADRYMKRFQAVLTDSIERNPPVVSTLLGSDAGRAYLLLDAAVGDLH